MIAMPCTSVLLRLDSDGRASVSALARAESVWPQFMRVMVAGLEAMGLSVVNPTRPMAGTDRGD